MYNSKILRRINTFIDLCDVVGQDAYMTVVRPAMMYATETWAMKKVYENNLNVADMKMLRWVYEVTKMDRIRIK